MEKKKGRKSKKSESNNVGNIQKKLEIEQDFSGIADSSYEADISPKLIRTFGSGFETESFLKEVKERENNLIVYLPITNSKIKLGETEKEEINTETESLEEPLPYSETSSFYSSLNSHSDSVSKKEMEKKFVKLIEQRKKQETESFGTKGVDISKEKIHTNLVKTASNSRGNGKEYFPDVIFEKEYPLQTIKIYEVLPSIYKCETWPKRTNIVCWWCCHSFNTQPIPCPLNYDRNKDVFQVFGCFCSFNCTIAYIKGSYLRVNKDIYTLFFTFFKVVTNEFGLKYYKRKDVVKEAPPREALNIFGGPLSISEFRESFGNTKNYSLINFPFVSSEQVIEEINCKQEFSGVKMRIGKEDYIKLKNDDKERLQEAKQTTTEGELLEIKKKREKLKRIKPLPGDNGTLSSLIKIRSRNEKEAK